jgi:hypothetical protein
MQPSSQRSRELCHGGVAVSGSSNACGGGTKRPQQWVSRRPICSDSALRLLRCPLELTIGLFVIVLAWLLRPRDMTANSDAAISAAIGSLGVLIALSALPVAADSEA